MRGGRIFAIEDIHGYLNKLEALMCKIHPDPELDELVFLRDYVDRGPNFSFLRPDRRRHRVQGAPGAPGLFQLPEVYYETEDNIFVHAGLREGIDTGAGYGGALTCLELPDGVVYPRRGSNFERREAKNSGRAVSHVQEVRGVGRNPPQAILL